MSLPRCPVTVDRESRIARLEAVVPSIIQRAEALNHTELYWQASEDDWSVMKLLAHVAEILPYWARQAKSVSLRAVNDQPYGRTAEDPDRIAAVEMHEIGRAHV